MILPIVIVAVVIAGCATGPMAEKRAEAQRLIKAAAEAENAKDLPLARQRFERAIYLFHETGDKEKELEVLRFLGGALARAGQAGEAIAVREEALKLARETKDTVQRYELLSLLARARRDLGEIDAAIRLSEEQLKLIESEGWFIRRDPNWVYIPQGPLQDLAWHYYRKGDYGTALKYAERAVTFVSGWRPSRPTLANLNNIYGLTNADVGNFATALTSIGEALRIWTEDGNKRQMATGLLNLAYVYRTIGDLQRAGELLDKALSLYKETGHAEYPLALFHAGRIRLDLNRLAEAEEFFSESLRLSEGPARVRDRLRALAWIMRER